MSKGKGRANRETFHGDAIRFVLNPQKFYCFISPHINNGCTNGKKGPFFNGFYIDSIDRRWRVVEHRRHPITGGYVP